MKDDGGLTGEAELDVRINRNLFPPVMDTTPLSAEILENTEEGTQFGDRVRATDDDSSVKICKVLVLAQLNTLNIFGGNGFLKYSFGFNVTFIKSNF